MTVIVDSREPDSLADTIREFADDVEREALNAGDFLVRDRLIERKDYGDFLNRLGDDENGVFMQMQRTVQAADEQDLVPVLLLEGDAQEALRWGQISMHELVSAIAGVHKMGATLMCTPDERSTAQFLATLERSSTEGDPHKIRDTPSVPEKYMSVYLTQGFANVGAKTAVKLLEHFGTFRAIVNADVEDLQAVDGVGPATAEKIYAHVRDEPEEYP